MTFPCVMKVMRISLNICISLNFSSFLSLHFAAFLYISLHFTAFLCISLHFSAFLRILHSIFQDNLTERTIVLWPQSFNPPLLKDLQNPSGGIHSVDPPLANMQPEQPPKMELFALRTIFWNKFLPFLKQIWYFLLYCTVLQPVPKYGFFKTSLDPLNTACELVK